jgi:predicted aspartyl protease
MFLGGFINENLEPLIENVFLIGHEQHIPLEAILDTGFNGMLCLPRKYQPLCELNPLGVETFELADGTLMREVLYLGQILLNDVPYFVELTLTDTDQALMGMELLLDKVATFDLKTMHIEVSY